MREALIGFLCVREVFYFEVSIPFFFYQIGFILKFLFVFRICKWLQIFKYSCLKFPLRSLFKKAHETGTQEFE